MEHPHLIRAREMLAGALSELARASIEGEFDDYSHMSRMRTAEMLETLRGVEHGFDLMIRLTPEQIERLASGEDAA